MISKQLSIVADLISRLGFIRFNLPDKWSPKSDHRRQQRLPRAVIAVCVTALSGSGGFGIFQKKHLFSRMNTLPDGDNFLFIAGEIASTHQERWDGTGYPGSLSGSSNIGRDRVGKRQCHPPLMEV